MLCAVGEEKVLLNCCVCDIWCICVCVCDSPRLPLPPLWAVIYEHTYIITNRPLFRSIWSRKEREKCVICYHFVSKLTDICLPCLTWGWKQGTGCVCFLLSWKSTFTFYTVSEGWIADEFIKRWLIDGSKWRGLGVRMFIFNFGNGFPCHVYCHSLICFR